MNRIVVDVPNEKMKAFEEALRNLEINPSDSGNDIPEEHKNFVRNVIATTKPENYRPWREVMADVRMNLENVKNKK